jgi:hypothetical protein
MIEMALFLIQQKWSDSICIKSIYLCQKIQEDKW